MQLVLHRYTTSLWRILLFWKEYPDLNPLRQRVNETSVVRSSWFRVMGNLCGFDECLRSVVQGHAGNYFVVCIFKKENKGYDAAGMVS